MKLNVIRVILVALFCAGCKQETLAPTAPSASAFTTHGPTAIKPSPSASPSSADTTPGPSAKAPAPTAPSASADAMKELRTMMLTTPASKVGIRPSETYPKVFGVVMDFPLAKGHTATVVSMCDGHASLYTTGTFGVLGGIGHEPVRDASKAFVKAAQARYDAAIPTADFPYPAPGHVRFYLIGFDGVRVLDAEVQSLKKGTDDLSDLWAAGQRVITELRLVTEKSGK